MSSAPRYVEHCHQTANAKGSYNGPEQPRGSSSQCRAFRMFPKRASELGPQEHLKYAPSQFPITVQSHVEYSTTTNTSVNQNDVDLTTFYFMSGAHKQRLVLQLHQGSSLCRASWKLRTHAHCTYNGRSLCPARTSRTFEIHALTIAFAPLYLEHWSAAGLHYQSEPGSPAH